MLGWALLHGCPLAVDDKWQTERLRARLLLLTCVANKQHEQMDTELHALANHLIKLPHDIIQHIARLM